MPFSKPSFDRFYEKVRKVLPKERALTDDLRRLAWGTDAGFYRMIPEIVLFPKTEKEMSAILRAASEEKVAVTFRAAGTSLSGQAISDSVLVVAGKNWEEYTVSDDLNTIDLQPGIVGQRVNDILAKFGRKISPDPASIKSAMIGGIIINNASGMNCGVHGNSDRVIKSARIIFADGTVLDTGNPSSREVFEKNHPEFLAEIKKIRDDIRADAELTEKIKRKYKIKNVTGLNLLPFVRFDDPFDIITHLMVGSEGTLAFLARAVLRTEKIVPRSASAMVYFKGIDYACKAVQALQTEPVASVELLDRLALRSIEGRPGMPDYLTDLPESATALLLETRAMTGEQLNDQIAQIAKALERFETIMPVEFTEDAAACAVWWGIRAGIFPSVGGMREPGTTTLIEDVAFPMEVLPEATKRLQELIAQYGYTDGVIYGHARDGNFHFILNQRFDSQKEIDRYASLMRDVVKLVADDYGGSLKAEHGTGRNMAPFVRREWGDGAFEMMRRVKRLFDPEGLINPGVIFNDDPDCFIRSFKPLPTVNPKVDKCIECGFCEVNCVTAGFTLSSRQRIVLSREMARLEKSGEDPERLRRLRRSYRYWGNMTCAGDGLCATSCPMGINTGDLTHDIRQANAPKGGFVWELGDLAANHLALIETALRPVLSIADLGHTVLGTSAMSAICNTLNKCGVPLWVSAMPKAHKVKEIKTPPRAERPKVVYFPSCINQTFGVAKESPDPTPLTDKMTGLLEKAGYDVIYPEGMANLCCGTIWESKGMPDIADRKTKELEAALLKASENGKYPVLCDQSPCLYRMRHEITSMKLYEPIEFIEEFLVDRLDFHPIDEPAAFHVTCSVTKMNLRGALERLAARCTTKPFFPEEIGCCGFAGDKGFTYPEVNRYALRKLRPQLEERQIKVGYSNSRTCEIGLTTNGGIPYMSIVYLVDKVTTPKGV
ncbi:MAG: FAD-binding oxidoreductase [Thermoguttaceae bacterium]|nr:FAD-binding oxidoreductase [Thermoguttaceae bacterium]